MSHTHTHREKRAIPWGPRYGSGRRAIGHPRVIVEKFVNFKREVSIIAVRGEDGDVASYQVAVHELGHCFGFGHAGTGTQQNAAGDGCEEDRALASVLSVGG